MQNRSVAARSLMRTILAFLALTIGLASPALAGASDEDVQTAWRLLDYVAVDYRGAVADGQVKSAQEFAEMTEFSGAVEARILALPVTADRAHPLSDDRSAVLSALAAAAVRPGQGATRERHA